jgi:hypothetical protein
MRSALFHQVFTIHPVGQGLFYSCTIRNEHREIFRMVFDCGSKTAGAGQTEVTEYRSPGQFVKRGELDLLVISHFDSDHVNHIKRLLRGIKIKKLVIPMVCFEERLFLAIKYMGEDHQDQRPEEIDSTFELILDPLTNLRDHFDHDTDIYIITSDPNPSKPFDGEDIFIRDVEQEQRERLFFDFPKASKEIADIKSGYVIPTAYQNRTYMIKDSIAGKVFNYQEILLMDFKFYRKTFGESELKFYEIVKDSIFELMEIDSTLSQERQVELLYEAIKKISSATQLKKIYQSALEKAGLEFPEIIDPNTTALCMLHKNLPSIHDYLGYNENIIYGYQFRERRSLHSIQKFVADSHSRVIEYPAFFQKHRVYRYPYQTFIKYLGLFPNVLLTSDAYLLDDDVVEAFMNRFESELYNFWLIQIPHHGSKESSDGLFHSQIPTISHCFVNYGVNNTYRHPSDSVIHSLVANGLSHRLIAVNEYRGCRFTYELGLV